MNKPVWLPHLILQRNLGVKDLTTVNFKANLVEHSFSQLEGWKAKENKPDMQHQVQSISGPNLVGNEDLLDNKRGQYFNKGGREPYLVYEELEIDKKTGNSLINSITTRGERVDFKLLGYSTFLFQTEYDLIKDVLDKIEEITIQVTYGLSPLFKVFAKLK